MPLDTICSSCETSRLVHATDPVYESDKFWTEVIYQFRFRQIIGRATEVECERELHGERVVWIVVSAKE